ncbi:putative gamma-glutamyltransferase YwrD [compost metagenome]
MERRVAPEVLNKLSEAGHLVRSVGEYDGIVGHAHAISIDANGYRSGGTDPRCDGAAIGW